MKAISLLSLIVLASPSYGQCLTGALAIIDHPTCTGGEFGNAIALDGDTLVVGDWVDNGFRGAAHIFQRTGTQWMAVQELNSNENLTNLRFGVDVAIDGDRAVVGAMRAPNRGAAFVFERTGTNWILTAKLTDPIGPALTSFGSSVDVQGDWIVVGEPRDGLDEGAVHFFHYDGTN